MKRQLSFAFLSILSVFCLSESLLAQINVWRWQNPSLQGGTLNAVQMLSLTTTIACGNKATVMKTTDGGLTWLVMPNVLGSMSNFNGISFLDANIGMICGDSGKVLKTTDGGNSWNLLFTNTKASLTGIAVVDVNTAIVIGAGGTILETFDAGNSWQTPTFEGNGQFTSIRKLRSDFITITGYNGQLYNSTDIGVSWHKIPLKLDTATIGNDIFGQVFISDYNATVIGQNGVILHTISGGDLWQMQKLGDSTFLTATLNAVDGKDPNILAIVGDYGTVVHTTNGGTTWSRVELGIRDSIKGLSFFDRLNATAVGQDGIILRTSDGGTTWSFLPSRPLIDQLNGVAFNKGDTSLGIAVGHFGAILRTTNGGAHWDAMNSGTLEELKAVTFLDASTLIAVGNHGTVLKSTTAGL
ncbi:MAG: YCF48-related protein, partial [Bacteroidota bacterium]|nr:YCF48-related protein [Bacteroidota bacterium]